MSSVLDAPKTRINCSMLSQHINRAVCLTGRVGQVHPTGKTFTVKDGEGNTATVELNEPLEEELSGIVEVVGMVSNKGSIMATVYNMLREDKKLEEELSGIVEVVGMVSNKGSIMATVYNMLREDKSVPFDLEMYNGALKVIQDFPQYYPFEASASR